MRIIYTCKSPTLLKATYHDLAFSQASLYCHSCPDCCLPSLASPYPAPMRLPPQLNALSRFLPPPAPRASATRRYGAQWPCFKTRLTESRRRWRSRGPRPCGRSARGDVAFGAMSSRTATALCATRRNLWVLRRLPMLASPNSVSRMTVVILGVLSTICLSSLPRNAVFFFVINACATSPFPFRAEKFNWMCSVCFHKDPKNKKVPSWRKKLDRAMVKIRAVRAFKMAKRLQQKHKNRCWKCKRKIGITGIECRCGYIFCGKHRSVEVFSCFRDFSGFCFRLCLLFAVDLSCVPRTSNSKAL